MQISILGSQKQLAIISNPPQISVLNARPVIQIASQGLPGVGVPTGGNTGQALVKRSDANYDTEWVSINNFEISAIAGETLSALRLVYTDHATAELFYADKDVVVTASSLLGVTLQAVNEGDAVEVLTAGRLQDDSWAWDMDADVNLFLGTNGAITQGFVSGGVAMPIGYAISATSILMRIGTRILTM